jgi:vancomycin aglycone glucosyltransferase
MRVVLSTYGSRGDVEPMTGLALRLRALGAEVRVCAPPDFAEPLEGLGFPLTPVGWPIRALATGAVTGRAPRTLPEIAADLTAMSYQAVTTAAGAGAAGDGVAPAGGGSAATEAGDGVVPAGGGSAATEAGDGAVAAGVVVVATGSLPAVAGARAAAEKLGAGYVHACLSPCYLPSPHHPPVPWPGLVLPADATDNRLLWRLNAEHLNRLFGETINTHRGSVGLPAADDVRDLIHGDRVLLAADPVLGPWPGAADLDVTQTGAWIRPDERRLPADLEAFLSAGTPPVYVGFGSMPLREAERVARAVVEAVRARGCRVLLGSGWAELAPIDDRADCFVVGELNQQALFPRVAAVVHHGGAGTTATAARAGAPQVIVPQVADQPYWAGRVTELGIGTGHDGPVPTAGSLSAALGIVLAPGVRTRAAAVAGTIRTDGADRAAKLLLDPAGRLGGSARPVSAVGGCRRTRSG